MTAWTRMRIEFLNEKRLLKQPTLFHSTIINVYENKRKKSAFLESNKSDFRRIGQWVSFVILKIDNFF